MNFGIVANHLFVLTVCRSSDTGCITRSLCLAVGIVTTLVDQSPKGTVGTRVAIVLGIGGGNVGAG